MSLRDDIRSARGWEDTWEYDEASPYPRIHKVRSYYDTPASRARERAEHEAIMAQHQADRDEADRLMSILSAGGTIPNEYEHREAAE